MALKQYKPNTPGQRGLVLVDKSDLYKGSIIKLCSQFRLAQAKLMLSHP